MEQNREYEERVETGAACPGCFEDRIDYLVWQEDEDGEYVRCTSCGAEYNPLYEGGIA